ncbi:uncharacterized protein LOC110037563 isoform X2 [Phalaenopsis equestris]|uniref:uncharacterized protein LOC110037563 isoform X2 n=1 Tax=Phalaenopsis equestris TaxID=78828 RepID=UPI0009E4E96E|nr:uncharacterized protein LOC110037563 isoform X2 [Phalaenopsis equestris]
MSSAVAATALSPFVMISGNLFRSYPGLSASSFSQPHSLRGSSTSNRPLQEQQRGKGLTSVALIASGAGFALAAAACAFPSAAWAAPPTLREPQNALSLPTWVIHVSSVIEWITAMALVWEYGEKSGFSAWKGLSWGMVPLLGGAMCACTWHFFYNSESLEILVAMQGASNFCI